MIDQLAKLPYETRLQVAAFAALSLFAFGLVALLSLSHGDFFQPYFGKIRPLPAIAIVIVTGAASLYVLYAGGWFKVINPSTTYRGIALSAALVAVFAVEVTVLDRVVRFPADINVPFPHSVLFYPAIAYVVEVVFHALPLALMLGVLSLLSGETASNRVLWPCIVLVAMIEPTYQLAFTQVTFSWTTAYLWTRLFAFNLVQLFMFKQFDFVTMYSFRLLYYTYWHIIWGYARLQVLL